MISLNRDFTESERPSITLFGDLIISEKYTPNPFSRELTQGIENSDLAVVNLEAPLNRGDPIRKDGPHLETADETPDILARSGFELLCLANNHMMDYDENGLKTTQEALSDQGLSTVGIGKNRDEAMQPEITDIDDTKVAIYNGCAHEHGIATHARPGTAWISEPSLTRNIIETRDEVDFVVVVAHGGSENVPLPSTQWQARLRELSKAGADVIVGHHPHVPQGWEVHDNSPIFYSLGNFLFDQDKLEANRWSYAVELILNEGRIRDTNVILLELRENEVGLIEKDGIEQHFDYLKRTSDIISNLQEEPGYWQEVAYQKNGHYKRFYQSLAVGDPFSIVTNPRKEISKVIQSIKSRSLVDIPMDQKPKLLNYIRAEQHREVMVTVLEMEIGEREDERTPEIAEKVNLLNEFIQSGSYE